MFGDGYTETAIQLSLALSSRVAYHRSVQLFRAFCSSQGLSDGWPLPVNVALAYCTCMHHMGLPHRTTPDLLVAITLAYKVAGYSDPCRDSGCTKHWEDGQKQEQSNGTWD